LPFGPMPLDLSSVKGPDDESMIEQIAVIIRKQLLPLSWSSLEALIQATYVLCEQGGIHGRPFLIGRAVDRALTRAADDGDAGAAVLRARATPHSGAGSA
jgi:hypothetical protein